MDLLPADLVIGKVEWADAVRGFARLVALKQLSSDGAWLVARPESFPPSGRVFWPGSGPLEVGSLHAFTIRWADPVGEGKDSILVDKARPCYPVIDMRGRTWEYAIRQLHGSAIDSRGLEQGADSVFLLCKERDLLGPLPVRVNGGRLLPDDRTNQLHRIELRQDASGVIETDSGTLLYTPVESADAWVDCRTDREILRSALGDAANLTRGRGGEVPELAQTKRFINETIQLVSESRLSVESALRLERALGVVEFQEALEESAVVLIDKVLELPSVRAEIEDSIEQARSRAIAEGERTIRQLIDGENSEIAKLREEREALERALEARRTEIAEETDRLEAEFGSFETRLFEKLEIASLDAGELLSDSLLLRVASGEAHRRSTRSGLGSSPFPAVSSRPAEAEPDALVITARQLGLPPTVLVRIHEVLHAGLLPVVTGPGAMTALHAYAEVVLAGRIAELPVTHDFLHPADLLGVRASDPGQSRLHGDLLASARRECTREIPGLVVLDGFNRGAADSYLLPWLAHPRREISVPRNLQAEGAERRIRLDDGLLLAATAGPSVTSAPLAVDFWNYAAVIHVPTPHNVDGKWPTASVIAAPGHENASPDLSRLLAEVSETVSPVLESQIDLLPVMSAVARVRVDLRGEDEAGEAVSQRAQNLVESVVVPALAAARVSPAGLMDDILGDVAAIVGVDPDHLEAAVDQTRRILG